MVFAVALGIRLVHLWQVRRAPFVETLLGDARSYDTWARQIAAGDWLGHDVFYQTPLYPYLLGILYTFGRNLVLVRICQALIGAGSCVLLAYATRRFFYDRDDRGDRAGLAAGLMLAVYAPAVFFDGLIQKAVLDVFLICLALLLLAGLMNGPRRPARWLGVGLTLGALALTRENSLLFLVVVPVWLWLHHRHLGALRIKLTALLLAGAAVVLVPVGLRNRVVGGEFHLTTAQFGPNFYIGNGPQAHGGYVAMRPGRGTAGVRARRRHRDRRAGGGAQVVAERGLELLDGTRPGLDTRESDGVARARRTQVLAGVERHGDDGHRKPGSVRRVVAGSRDPRTRRALGRAGAAGPARRLGDVEG